MLKNLATVAWLIVRFYYIIIQMLTEGTSTSKANESFPCAVHTGGIFGMTFTPIKTDKDKTGFFACGTGCRIIPWGRFHLSRDVGFSDFLTS